MSEQEPIALVDSSIIRDGKSGPVVWLNGYPPDGTYLYAAPTDCQAVNVGTPGHIDYCQAAIATALESVLEEIAKHNLDHDFKTSFTDLFNIIRSRINSNPLADLQAKHLEQLAAWTIDQGFATGHADTVDDLLAEVSGQIAELRARVITSKARIAELTGRDG